MRREGRENRKDKARDEDKIEYIHGEESKREEKGQEGILNYCIEICVTMNRLAEERACMSKGQCIDNKVALV